MDKEDISIHAPRTGSDQKALKTGADPVIFQSTLPARGATEQPQGDDRDERQFQSTLPARGATVLSGHVAPLDLISIHAPRTGSDRTRRANITTFSDFNPRSPHGERLVHGDTARRQSDFNPRSPHGERQR